MAAFTHKEQCKSCAAKGGDSSKDNYAVYADGSGHCFACGFTELSDEYKAEHYTPEDLDEEYSKVAGEFNAEIYAKVKADTSTSGAGYRSISDRTYKVYNVRHQFDQETGEVVRQYYPVTTDYKLTGLKCRIHPKDFSKPLGKIGKECNLFGQIAFQHSVSKTVIIGSGECDAMAIYDMLSLWSDKKGYEAYPVVSSTIGEGGVAQFAANYEWLDRFEKIVIVPDNDDAGQAAAQKLLKVLPKGKVYIVELPLKDANDMLIQGKENDFINRFFKAKAFLPDGLTASTDLKDAMYEYLNTERLALAPCMRVANEMLKGGLAVGTITNFLSSSGAGKTTLCDANILEWILNSNRKVGIMALEASEGEYSVNLASAFLGFKLNLLHTPEERIAYMEQPEVQEKLKELWTCEDGTPRFYLMSADITNIQQKGEYLARALGCSVLVYDCLQNILDIMDDTEQQHFLSWQMALCKSDRLNIININHARKNAQGQKANSHGAELTEESIHGTSSIYKAAAVNIILMRNKDAEDETTRNTTRVKITKARGVGITGNAGSLYYDNATHTLHDLETWEKSQGKGDY